MDVSELCTKSAKVIVECLVSLKDFIIAMGAQKTNTWMMMTNGKVLEKTIIAIKKKLYYKKLKNFFIMEYLKMEVSS